MVCSSVKSIAIQFQPLITVIPVRPSLRNANPTLACILTSEKQHSVAGNLCTPVLKSKSTSRVHSRPSLESAKSPVPVSAAVQRLATFNQPDLLVFSHLRWHFVTQRPQHLLTRAAKDRRVFYWEEPVWHHNPNDLPLSTDGTPGMHLEVIQEAESLWIVRPHMTWGIDSDSGQTDLLNEFIKSVDIERFALWYYTPMALGFTSHLTPEITIYDCMDELSAFKDAPAQLTEREHMLLSIAEVVFTGGISLYESKKRKHANVHAFPSSIDLEHFSQTKHALQGMEPADQSEIPHPRAGFYGVLDERFDIDLFKAVARLRLDVHFVVIGPVAKIDPARLPLAANIHYLGSKTYSELTAYLAGWDVALMPFALNEATRYISPTKTPEYLAAGKPVVSTPIHDVVTGYGDTGLVAIADTPEAFATAIDHALLPRSTAWSNAVAAKLAGSSWDLTWAAMQHQISRATESRIRASTRSNTDGIYVSPEIRADILVPGLQLPTIRVTSHLNLSKTRKDKFDYLVVGAGFAGSVLAERLASQLDKQVLVIDKRSHIGGNAYDHYNEHGILVHKYGPHIFHTNSEKVLAYLSQFTSWRPYEHRVLGSIDGQLLPIPINLDTINRLYGLTLNADGMKTFLDERAIVPAAIRTSEDIVVSRVGRELYEKFFKNYTRKQWGIDPSQLDSSVAGRIPVRFDTDDRYFSDAYQVMPLDGYTHMFERMLDQPNITVRTGVDYRDIARTYPSAKLIYTGPIDEYFDFRFGPLPYRSLEFRHETHDRETFQSAPVVNYPNEHDYTRITEFKYLTGQQHAKTSIVYEYPRTDGDPYYPIPRPENAELYARYHELASRDSRVHFCGRLANYRYLNMDQVVAQALSTFTNIARRNPTTLTTAPAVVATDVRAQIA
jgi:UDP-galactopyranose mutase